MTAAGIRQQGTCPKHMVYGPCGGVTTTGGCEIDAVLPCPFVATPTVTWQGGPPTASKQHPLLDVLATRQVVIADLPTAPLDRTALQRSADLLAGNVDAVLIGDHPGARVQFPPSYRAHLLRDRGIAVWAGLNCRDRNRVALEGELAALADADVVAVHCVTGDHPALGHRRDAAPVFDLDSTRLAARARTAGLLVSVAESPCGPPADRRPGRLAEKVRAGAQVCLVNHAGGAGPVAAFVAAGPDIPYIACVPVVLGPEQARLLATFPGLVLPPGFLAGILDAPDPAVAGIDAAVQLAEELLAVPGVRGVDLGALPVKGAEDATATALATVARALRG
ncbi:MAG: methylenetetrahydrofolate reductase C-terminal domain-containing protein [Pseudonocardiales bacterium]|nr:methylenetetrahydrofolate reductase C-terminal domain-containing protein [Pseudonocardiales bacterium]